MPKEGIYQVLTLQDQSTGDAGKQQKPDTIDKIDLSTLERVIRLLDE